MTKPSLGKLISVHGTSPVFLQRAAIVAFTSFLFFLGMLIAFYIRQHFGYFLLSTAFLVVFLFTMTGWWLQKRNTLYIYDRGLVRRRFSGGWSELKAVESSEKGLIVTHSNGQAVTIARSTAGFESIEPYIVARLENR